MTFQSNLFAILPLDFVPYLLTLMPTIMKRPSTPLFTFTWFIFLISLHSATAQVPLWNWAAGAGGFSQSQDKGQSCVTDAQGNLYVTGYFYSPGIMFDSVQLINTTANFKADIFLAKYSSAGNLLWAKNAGGTDNDYSMSCALDPNGNIIITGYFTSPILTVGGFNFINSGAEDIFIAQFNSSGNVTWAKTYGGGFTDIAFSVNCDSIGTAYVCGYFTSPEIIFDFDTLHNSGNMDLYLIKFGISVGTVSWARSAMGSDNDVAYCVAADASGNAYIGGYYLSSTLDFGTSSLSNQGVYDLFVAKYDGAGILQWVNEAGGSASDVSRGITLDQTGNVYLTGYFGSPTLSFGNTNLSASANDVFLASFDNNGNDRWAKSAGAAYGEEGNSVCTDFSGNIFVTGLFSSPSITIGSTTLTNAGSFNEDVFVAAYDNNGNNLWAKSVGGSDVDVANGICADQTYNVYITGYYESNSLSFDGITINNIGGAPYQDVFMARLSTYVGIPESELNNNLLIFPNPATDQLTVGNSDFAIKNIEIVDVTGKTILSKENVLSLKQIDINISKLPADIYFIRIETDKTIFFEKFVKQ